MWTEWQDAEVLHNESVPIMAICMNCNQLVPCVRLKDIGWFCVDCAVPRTKEE